jgi:hypothetical protein
MLWPRRIGSAIEQQSYDFLVTKLHCGGDGPSPICASFTDLSWIVVEDGRDSADVAERRGNCEIALRSARQQ